MAKLTASQIHNCTRRTQLYAETIAENVCESLEEGISDDELDRLYEKLIDLIDKSVKKALEEFDDGREPNSSELERESDPQGRCE